MPLTRRGAGATIRYVLADSLLGPMLLACTAEGVCALSFGDRGAQLVDDLRALYPESRLVAAEGELARELEAALAALDGREPQILPGLDVPGTEFQHRAWAAMQRIPRGHTRTYQELAAEIGCPQGQIAVGQACASNPVALLIPCHRVLAKGNRAHHWRWGLERKERLLALEQMQAGLAPRSGSQKSFAFGD